MLQKISYTITQQHFSCPSLPTLPVKW